MFCPRCGQEQISEETRFCSRCGFLMTAVAELVASGGEVPKDLAASGGKNISPRKKGLKQGAILFLSSLILVPLIAIITIASNAEPFVVAIAAILTFWGGILRMLYALVFESGDPTVSEESVLPEFVQNALPKKKKKEVLPPQTSVPVSSYVPPVVGNWRGTNDLTAPSVTEGTTKLLEVEDSEEVKSKR